MPKIDAAGPKVIERWPLPARSSPCSMGIDLEHNCSLSLQESDSPGRRKPLRGKRGNPSDRKMRRSHDLRFGAATRVRPLFRSDVGAFFSDGAFHQ
jgi:hypothetical protein